MKQIIQHLLQNKRLAKHILSSSFFIALLSLATSLFVIQVLNRFIAHGINGTLVTLIIGTLLALVFEIIFRSIRRQLIVLHNTEHDYVLSIKAFEVLLTAEVLFLDRVPPGQRSEIVRGIDILRAATMPQNIAALLDIPFSLIFLLVLGLLNPVLMIIAIFAILSSIFIAWRAQRIARAESIKLQAISADRANILSSAITSSETIRAFNGSGFLLDNWHDRDKGALSLRVSMANDKDALSSKLSLINNIQTVAVISAGALLVISGDISMGAMIGANILASRALMPVTRLVQMAETFIAAEHANKLLQEFILLPLERKRGTALRHYDGAISFNDLAFVYPGVSVLLFESLNLSIQPGQCGLIVGPNGSGKTTLLHLLLGLIEPSRGQVLVGDLDLKQLALPWWRQQVCYLPQEPILLTATLQENITLANPQIDESRLNEIINDAELRTFLSNSQEGLEMPITEGGKHLALGIRRRVAIARALATDGQLFIADEPTEGLDDDGKRAVYLLFQKLKNQGKTLIVVSHDESFLRIADLRIDLTSKPIPTVQYKKPDSVPPQNNPTVKDNQENKA